MRGRQRHEKLNIKIKIFTPHVESGRVCHARSVSFEALFQRSRICELLTEKKHKIACEVV